jgi:glycosyltransferase involved in cell wall biosynthesis
MNKVSVIITTRNEEKNVKKLLESLKKQMYKNIEVILVDNQSTDNTVKISRDYTKKIFSYGPERSAQRNFGAINSTGEYLLFIDADMELTPHVVSECLKAIKLNKNIAGIVIPEESIATDFWGEVKAFERSFYNESGDQTTDAARFFNKSIFDEVGGYDESLTGPEDWDLPERIQKKGYKIGRITAVIKHHERIESLVSLARKKYYYGLKAYRYLVKHKHPIIGSKTIYFLRPVFYKNWRKIISNPLLSLGMVIMFTVEIISGGLGYFIGRFKDG